MSYEKGDILFFKPRSIKSKVIAWFDGSPFSHVGIYFGKIEDTHVFLDASWDGVKIRPLMWHWDNYVAVSPRRSRKVALSDVIRVNYNKKYDYVYLFKVFLYKITLGLYVPKSDLNRFICSELVNYIYQIQPRGVATPASLWKYFDNLVKE